MSETDEQVDQYPWQHWPPYGQSEVREVRFATQEQAIAYGATNAVYAPRSVRREPQPSDGPDYHAEHAAWLAGITS